LRLLGRESDPGVMLGQRATEEPAPVAPKAWPLADAAVADSVAGRLLTWGCSNLFERNWVAGEATIVALKEIGSIGRVGPEGESAKARSFEFLADVRPVDGRDVFRTVLHEPFDERSWYRPSVGDVVAVKVHPRKERAKFEVASSADRREQKRAKQEQAAAFDALRDAAPGSGLSTYQAKPAAPASAARDASGGQSSNPRADLARLAIRQARRKGDQAEVERLTAMLADLEDGGTSG
jgi:hypothetical protein